MTSKSNVTDMPRNETQETILEAIKDVPINPQAAVLDLLLDARLLAGLAFDPERFEVSSAEDEIDTVIADLFINGCRVANMYSVKLNPSNDGTKQTHTLPAYCAMLINMVGVLLVCTVDEKQFITPHLRSFEATLASIAKLGEGNLQELVNQRIEMVRV